MTASYDAIKEVDGRKYTGMRVGGSHDWYYKQGEWKETKVAPDRWQFSYVVDKRRRWDAPEGSGAPLGTEYHWYILADQCVRKLNANEYSTSMTGVKYKLAHRRAANKEWSASEAARLRRLIVILEENVLRLQQELGETDIELEAKPVAVTMDTRQNEVVRGRRMSPRNLPPGMMPSQPPLETYLTPRP